MEQLIKYFTDNGQLIFNTITALVILLNYVVKLTPSTKDDTAVAKFVEILKKLSLYK